ncbi:MBL fold metallo-hydrolase [Bacillus sp. 31A1R]|uniref:MBL fold metallo-hydrolase n=1 Tax=Robertmurraya mangrovi TaxID=3098077 RepID=A0ABU5J0X6_9BACI|nr:MBL fold metallo-hydrolase [Bacillus sp. 31A1R]MDZ5473073.1 MBL fold metallo-hydrolase [Bacillus sp. 31A1R]
MKFEKIKNRNYVFTKNTPWGWDLTIHVIKGDKFNYVIDTGLGSEHFAPVLEFIMHDNKPIIAINTHYHWDHIWGNSSLPNGMLVSHKLCRDMIEEYWEEMIQKNQKCIEGETAMVLPNVTFDQELYFPEDKIRLIYTPGHTIDSISVLDEVEGVLNAADNIGDSLEELIPSLAIEKEQYIQTLLKYKELDFDTCISGHNVVLDKSVIDQILNLIQ